MGNPTLDESEAFETYRPTLLALAYRMLGDLGRAEDVVQDAWVRWQRRAGDVAEDIRSPKAFLLTTVTHLCMDELGSARVQKEELGDRLPEPIALEESGLGRLEKIDRISMAFLVVLQRLTPAERAVFLLHEVLDLSHAEIGALLAKSEAACRQLLRTARAHIASEQRAIETSPEEHRRLLLAFVRAIASGDQDPLLELLTEDAVLVGDSGPVPPAHAAPGAVWRPLAGARKIAALISGLARRQGSYFARQAEGGAGAFQERVLNGEPAIVMFEGSRPVAAMFVAIEGSRIGRIFVQADQARLKHLGLPD